MVATITPAFVSSVPRMWLFGIAVLLSYIVTAIFYADFIVSVWCFFAAVISALVYYILPSRSRAVEEINPVTAG